MSVSALNRSDQKTQPLREDLEMTLSENAVQIMGIVWAMAVQTLQEIPFDFDPEVKRQELLEWTNNVNRILRGLVPHQSIKDPMSLDRLLALKRLADGFPKSDKLTEHLKACNDLKEQAEAVLESTDADLIAIYAQDFCEHHREYVTVCTELEVVCWEPLNALARRFASIVKENK